MSERALHLWSIARVPAAVLLVTVAFVFSVATVSHGRYAMGDFKAFYCSGSALLHHENPYATGPMARCEAMAAPVPLYVAKPGEVLPAPVPGYVAAVFAPFALLPFPLAAALWLVLLAAATAAAIVLLCKTGVGDPASLAVALALVVVAICFPVGELPPVALLGIALAAWAARRHRQWLFAVGVALTFSEPQIGIALLVAALALGRRFALPALVATFVLGLVSLTAVGVAGNLEYFRVVLPAHLLSELPSVLQYSLSWMLYGVGVAPIPALLVGRLSWIVMLGVTFWFARGAFARARPEVAFLAAPAFAVVGGPFLHLDHIALAVPAALWLASNAAQPSFLRSAAVIALSVPVLYVFSNIRLAALVPFVAGWLGGVCGRGAIAGLRAALAAIVALAFIGMATVLTGTGSMHISPLQPLPESLPQAAWAQYIGKHFVMTAWTIWLVKAPIWFGIVATAAGLIRLAQRPSTEPV
ncbi:MAG TPA: glycosyltransferase 87 family protein [Candidatus Tyrphobacter sp.]